MMMRLAYITRSFPFAHLGETFLAPEVRSLSLLCAELHVIPARPHLRASTMATCDRRHVTDVRIGTANIRMLRSAFIEGIAHPRRAGRAFWSLLAPRYRMSAKIKNIALFPTALALARYVRIHRIEHIHAHWLTTPATVAYVASMMTGVPWSCTAHAHDIFSDNLLKQKLASARFVRVIADRNLQHLADFTGCPAQRLHRIHVGVEIPYLPVRERTNRALQIICAARLDPIKGHEYLIRGLAEARDRGLVFHCDIVGDGPLTGRLRLLISQRGLGRLVTLRGRVPYASLLDDLRCGRYDVLVLPSVEFQGLGQHEGIPVALIEAMAHAIPCVASATGCIPELIDETTGVLTPQRDQAALADAFIRLAADPALRRTLGEAGRERVIAEFDVAATTRALYGLISSVLYR